MKTPYPLVIFFLLIAFQVVAQEQLVEPQVLSSKKGKLDFTVSLTKGTFETSCHTITTRLYQVGDNTPTSPGPTLRLNKGDALNVHLINNLPADESQGTPNTFRAPNTTNFHTHGLHVSPAASADDVLYTDITGGQELKSKFSVPNYHTSGTYWYHPHFHGSTAIQVGGGAIGAIIVEDSKSDKIPVAISSMPEKLLVFSQIKLDQMRLMTGKADDDLWQAQPKESCSQAQISEDADSFLVNGQSHPYLEIETNQWTRLRLLNGAMMSWLEINKPESCEFQLLAKDGIYLNDAPREVTHSVLPGGGRADIAIKCSSTGDVELKSAQIKSTNEFLWEGNLLTLRVLPSEKPVADALPKLCYSYPCYLPDLQNTVAQGNTTFSLTDDASTDTFLFDGQSFNISEPAYTMELETTQNFTLENINFHTFHIHISPFQLLMDGGPEDDNYFLAGDWHDTIFLPDLPIAYDNKIKVGYQSDGFAGDYVMHCHILPHEDQGMMSYIHVTGEKHLHSLCQSDSGSSWPAWKWGVTFGVPTSVICAATAVGSCFLRYFIKRRGRAHYIRLEGVADDPMGN